MGTTPPHDGEETMTGSATETEVDESTETVEKTVAIARQEADDTFESIANLDSICDTSIVGITFLLTAIVGWAGFVLPRLETLSLSWVGVAATSGGGALCIFISSYYIVKSLVPRAFYTNSVGEVLIDRPLLPGTASPTAPLETIRDINDDDSSKAAFEEWLQEYGNNEQIETVAEFQYSRLFHYKRVAQLKATATTHAIVWLRLAVGCVVLTIVLGITGLIVTG